MNNQNRTRIITHMALLIALEIILSRFLSLSTPIAKISFAFIPLAICGILYGPVYAGVVGGLSDIIGVALFPNGIYFPGFTLSAVLSGAIYGFCLKNGNNNYVNLVVAVVINRILISLCLTTFWLTLLTNVSFDVIISARVIQNIVMLPVQIVVIRLLQVKLYVLYRNYQVQ